MASPFRFLRLLLYWGLGFALLAYGLVCWYLYSHQTELIYAATQRPITTEQGVADARRMGLVPWGHPTPGAASPQGFVRPDFAEPARRGTMVVFHGNGEWAWGRPDTVEALSRRGFRVFCYEYPGYGGRPGRPSEEVIVPDAQALVRSLAEAGYGPVYIWSHSLGCGVASAVCSDTSLPVQGLVLLAPWDTIVHAGLAIYPLIPVPWLMIDRYDSVANLQHFGHPIYGMYGDRDEIIPPRLTVNLFDHLAEPKRLKLQAGYGHGDWPDGPGLPWWDEALDFVAPVGK